VKNQKKAVERILHSQDGKVLRPDWEYAWTTSQTVFTAWFSDIKQGERVWQSYYDRGPLNQIEDHRSWELLYEVFRALMPVNFTATSRLLQERYSETALAAIAEFLEQVGVIVPEVHELRDPITLGQAAELLALKLKTLQNRCRKNPPPAPVQPGVWSFAALQPWMKKCWPKRFCSVPANYEAAKRSLE